MSDVRDAHQNFGNALVVDLENSDQREHIFGNALVVRTLDWFSLKKILSV